MQNTITRKFLELDSSQIPLIRVDFDEMKKINAMNPVTGKPYKGIILKGVFADLSNNDPNNNRRYYDIPSYLNMVSQLRTKVFSKKGVYGELEHPESYAVNYNRVSHKILDLWYDENLKCVMGYVMLLNTDRGLQAQQIVESGGQLSISARAAGAEIKNPDGSFNATTKLLTTYDLVYHPGFARADLEFVELNESFNMFRQRSNTDGFRVKLYKEQLVGIKNKYEEFTDLSESTQECFLSWYSKLVESDQSYEKQKQEEILQENEPSDEDEKQRKLQLATDKDLKQKQLIDKKMFFNQINSSFNNISGRYSHLNKSFYDNSAGFLKDGIDTNLSQKKK